MADTIRELILQNIEETLSGISVASGYNFDMKFVERGRVADPRDEQYPCALIHEGRENKEIEDTAQTSAKLMVTIEAGLKTRGNLSTDANKLLADIQVAMLADITRGGNGIDTDEVGNEMWVDSTDKPVLWLVVDFLVHYHHTTGDPYT